MVDQMRERLHVAADPAEGPAESALDNDPLEGLSLPETAQAVRDNLWKVPVLAAAAAIWPAQCMHTASL